VKKRKRTSRDDNSRLLPLPKAPKLNSAIKEKKLDTTPCSGCGELFCNSSGEWMGCNVCLAWFELTCAGMLGKSNFEKDNFVCKDCR